MDAKQIIFNVGAGFCSYLEAENHKVLFDLGRSSEFCPITDFLVPLFEHRNNTKNDNGKYIIDQLFISHPHSDHICAIEDFDKKFYATLITTPNDNDGMFESDKINWQLIDNKTQDITRYLRENVLKGRIPPLKSSAIDKLFIYWIPPTECELNQDLDSKNYPNNISLVVFATLNNHKIFLPGDLMKDGMEYIVKRNSGLRNKLKEGVDFLIAPHHGLQSSFSEYFFNNIPNNKTKRLNIISETSTSENSDRIVDSRYSSQNYCEGLNNLSTQDSVYQRKTSGGHIILDYSSVDPTVKIVQTEDYQGTVREF